MRIHRRIAAFGLGLIMAVGVDTPSASQTAILVRHAEKADASRDTDLSELGRQRAEALAHALADAGITHVLTTPLARTRQTAGPTAMAAGVAPMEVSLNAGLADHAREVADRVRTAGEGAVVLVVGHSNTIPEIARALGDVRPESLDECDFDRLVVLRLNAEAAPQIVRSRYGTASEDC